MPENPSLKNRPEPLAWLPKLPPWLVGGLVMVGITWLHLGLLEAWALPVPFWDQWSGEGTALIKPLVHQDLTLRHFFEPHNHLHFIPVKRVLDYGLMALNGGIWDPPAQMVTGMLFFTAAMALLAGVTLKLGGRLTAGAFIAWSALAAIWPLHWQNIIWAFQNTLDVYYLFSVAAFVCLARTWGPKGKSGVWIAWATISSVLAAFSLGGGFFTGITCIFAAHLFGPRHPGKKWLYLLLYPCTLAVIAYQAWVMTSQPAAEPGTRPNLSNLLLALSWPLTSLSPWSAVLCLPLAGWLLLVYRRVRKDAPWLSPALDQFLIIATCLWCWSFLQQLAVVGVRAGTSSRHLPFLWFSWIGPLLLGLCLYRKAPWKFDRFVGLGLAAFGLFASIGAFVMRAPSLKESIRAFSAAQVSEFNVAYAVLHGEQPDAAMKAYGGQMDADIRVIWDRHGLPLVKDAEVAKVLPPAFHDEAFAMAARDTPTAGNWLDRESPSATYGWVARAGRFLIRERHLCALASLGLLLLAWFFASRRLPTSLQQGLS